MDDLISRQALLDAFGLSEKTRKYGGDHSGYDTMMLYEIQDVIEDLPSAQPETHEKRTETHECDCISRQDAIDAIADYLSKTTYTSAISFLNTGALILARVPSAESEIVRCKDCKHQVKEWRTDKRLKGNGYMVCGCDVVGDACGYWALLGRDDDYCSYAERRADEDGGKA